VLFMFLSFLHAATIWGKYKISIRLSRLISVFYHTPTVIAKKKTLDKKGSLLFSRANASAILEYYDSKLMAKDFYRQGPVKVVSC